MSHLRSAETCQRRRVRGQARLPGLEKRQSGKIDLCGYGSPLGGFEFPILAMNVITSIYTSLPILLLLLMLLNWVLWPILGRFAFSLVRHERLGNRRILLGIG